MYSPAGFSRVAIVSRSFPASNGPSFAREKGPSGRVTPRPTRPSSIPTSSRLAPPRSAATPLAPGMPAMTPRAAYRASSSPDRTRMTRPVSAATRSQKVWPSAASRTAAVAATKVRAGLTPSMTAANRFKAVRASSAPSSDSRPVDARSRPSPASTFSLNTVQTARPSRRYRTRRTELEPMSTAANSRGASKIDPVAGASAVGINASSATARSSAGRAGSSPCGRVPTGLDWS